MNPHKQLNLYLGSAFPCKLNLKFGGGFMCVFFILNILSFICWCLMSFANWF